MFTLRCTQRLLARAKPDLARNIFVPTTRLGDWYANLIHVGRLQLVLAVSERSFLPVVLPAAPVATWVPRFRVGVGAMLDALGVPSADIDRELAEMESTAFGRTANRQVTGILVDFAKAIEFYIEGEPSLLAVALKLAQTPCSPFYTTRNVSPDSTTLALFATPSA